MRMEKSRLVTGKNNILNSHFFEEGIYAEILPLPGSTFGGKNYKRMGKNIDLALLPIKYHIEEAKKYLPEDAEIIIHGRSYGATLAAALSHKYKNLVDKIVLVGLATPRQDIIEAVAAEIHKYEELGKQGLTERFDQDWDWTNWFHGLVKQVRWYDSNKLATMFGGTKALILIGENDFQVSSIEREMYADFALKYPNVKFHLLPSSDHDATKTKYGSNRLSRIGVYANSLAFQFIFDK